MEGCENEGKDIVVVEVAHFSIEREAHVSNGRHWRRRSWFEMVVIKGKGKLNEPVIGDVQ